MFKSIFLGQLLFEQMWNVKLLICHGDLLLSFYFWCCLQINSTENRSVLHVALRAPRDAVIQSDGKNVVPDVWEVLDKIQKFSETIRSGSWVCYTIFFYMLRI